MALQFLLSSLFGCGVTAFCCGVLVFLGKAVISALDEEVVPLYQLLYVGEMHAVAVVVGQYACHEVGEFFLAGLAVVDGGRLPALFVGYCLENLHKRLVVFRGVHGHVVEGGDAVARSCRHAAVCSVYGFNDEHAASLGNEAVKSGLAGYGQNGVFHFSVVFECEPYGAAAQGCPRGASLAFLCLGKTP